MAKEILAIPEHLLDEVITIIRFGLFLLNDSVMISDRTRNMLKRWIEEEEEYLGRLEAES